MATDLKPQPGDEIKPDIKPDLGRGGEPSTGKQTESDHTEKSGQDIAGKESTASNKDGQNTSTNNKEEKLAKGPTDDTVGKGYSPRNKKKKGTSTRKKITLIIATVGITGSIATAFISSPVFILNHIRDVLTSKVNELQNGQQRRYRRKKIARVSDAFSRDGRLGSKIMLEMEARGYRFHFDPNDRNKISGISHPDRTGIPNNDLGAVAREIDDFTEKRHPLRTSRWKTRRMQAFYRRFGVQRIPITEPGKISADGSDTDIDPTTKKNRRLFSSLRQNDVEVNLKASGSGLDDDATDAEKDAHNSSLDNQTSDGNNSGGWDGVNQDYADGTPNSTNPNPAVKIHSELTTGTGPNLLDAAEKGARSGSLAGRTFGTIKGFISTTDIPDRLCTIKNRLRAAVTGARSYRSLAMMRYTFAILGAADATRTGRVDPKIMGALLSQLTSSDVNGQHLGSSSGFSYATTGLFSKSKNDITRSGNSVDGKLTGVYGSIQGSTNIRGCGVWQNPVFQVGAAIVEGAVTFFTGGTGKAFSQGARQAAMTTIKASIERATAKAIAKSAVRLVATAALVELSFEGVMFLTQMYAEKTLTANFSGQESGATAGNILVGGAGTMSKQRNLQAGQVPATVDQYAPIHTAYMKERSETFRKESFFARVFDYSNVNSLAYSVTSKLAFSGSGVSTVSNGLLMSTLRTPLSFLGMFSGRAGAQDSDQIAFDTYITEGNGNNKDVALATDPSGNLQTIMRSDIEDIDPVENIEFLKNSNYIDAISLEPIGNFAKHVENCVYSIDTISMIEGGDSDNPAQDCLANGANMAVTIRFKAHLAYIDMVDSLEAEFLPETLNGSDTESNDNGGIIIEGDFGWPLLQSKSQALSSTSFNDANETVSHGGHPYLSHDLFAPEGTKVLAAVGGEVIRSKIGTCGHGFNSALSVQIYEPITGVTYFYQHMNPAFQPIPAGRIVQAGEVLGEVGSKTAACGTPPHLHIDAADNKGRPPCSRLSCSTANKELFIDISHNLYKAAHVLR